MFGESELELVGAIIGDGHIHIKNSKYYFGLTGNKITDRDYFSFLATLIGRVWGKKVKVFESGRGIRIRVYSKSIVTRLTSTFNLPFNKGKCFRVCFPKNIIDDFEKCKHVIRGITDTDGSIFTSSKKGAPNYPSIEITTASVILANQLRGVLVRNGYRVANVRQSKSKSSNNVAYKVGLYGINNLKMWVEKIGFSNPIKLKKAHSVIGYSF